VKKIIALIYDGNIFRFCESWWGNTFSLGEFLLVQYIALISVGTFNLYLVLLF
jgi:hypothetical protein